MSSITNIWKIGTDNNGNGTNNNQFYISESTDVEKKLTIQRGTGIVGIGTNTNIFDAEKNIKLDINGSINLSGDIYKNGEIYVSDSTTWIENGEKIYYSSGKVGINTTVIDPNVLLEVNGTIKATNIIANGSQITNLNATNITTGTLDNNRLPDEINVSSFEGSGAGITNINPASFNSGNINTIHLPDIISGKIFSGNGANITNLNASNIYIGTLSNDRMPLDISVNSLSGDGSGITDLNPLAFSGNINNSQLPADISVTSFSGNGSGITNLNASNITSGKLNNSQLPYIISDKIFSGNGSGITNLNASNFSFGKINNSIIPNNLTISGTFTSESLQVNGTTTYINTDIYQTSKLNITNTYNTESSLNIIHYPQTNVLNINDNNVRRFTITNAGNVGIGGIGFPNSSYKLDVEGNINSSGTISSDIVLIRDNINFYKSSIQNILIKIPETLLSSYTITLPNAGPSANNILKSDSSGNLSWVDWVNNNESLTLENLYTFFDNTEFEKTINITSNITLKNINPSKLLSAFNSSQFELSPNGEPQIISIKESLLTSPSNAGGNVNITSINEPPSVSVNNLNIVIDKQRTDSAEPITTPSVSKQIPADLINYQYITLTYESAHPNYTSTTDGNQRTHTINFPENVVADILVVGGGGAGGGNGQGGGGGGGAVIYYEKIDLNGNYTIKVGKGATATNLQNRGDNGYDSLFYRTNDNLQKFVAKGGGGGGSWNSSGYNARDGGSGGGGAGGSASINGESGLLISGNIVNDVNISISSNSYNNTGFTGNRGVDSLNDTGCFGNIGGYEPAGGDDDWGAGGGGAGTIGAPTIQGSVDVAGDGGSGKKFNITGNVSYYGGGGGGGMRPTADFNTGSRAGYGGLGGGGNGGGGASGTQDSNGFDGTNGTGGGGGGVGAITTANYRGGNGGSGIVIIRYYVVSSITHKYLAFTYTGTTQNDTTYQVIFPVNTTCDILVVGGGGAGGNSMGGGGGAGGVVYTINQTLNAGTYTIGVGKGGLGLKLLTAGQGTIGADQDGKDSFIKDSNGNYVSLNMGGTNQNLRAYGGGGGGIYYNPAYVNGRNGGSGGGCSETNNNNYVVNTAGSALQGNTYWNGSTYVAGGKPGRQNTTQYNDWNAGGGGGAGSNGNVYKDGNNGVSINITGTQQYYAAGGGAGQYSVNYSTNEGKGGSGIGGNGRIYNGSSYLREATSGTNGTGSGGGGGAYEQNPDNPAGSGGSGIVIIRYSTLFFASNVETENIIPKGYLKYDNGDWFIDEINNNDYLSRNSLYNELALSRYLSNNNFCVINTYQYSVNNNDWYDIDKGDIIYISKTGYSGTYSEYKNNFTGNILFIKVKSCSLDNIYNQMNISSNNPYTTYAHVFSYIIPTISSTTMQSVNYYGGEQIIFSINLNSINLIVNFKNILAINLTTNYNALTDTVGTSRQQTDKFYLFYEEF